MKRLIALLLASVFSVTSLTGCYGKFGLVKTIYQANGALPDKYLRSGLTWLFIIFPVYEFAGLLDFLVFNTIEFWTGRNPVAAADKDIHYAEGSDSWDIHVQKRGDIVTMDITHFKYGMMADTMQLTSNTATGYSTSESNRHGVASHFAAWRTTDGSITVRTGDGITTFRG